MSEEKATTKQRVTELKSKLNELNEEKEKWYAQREAYSKQIREEIGKIKGSLQERNQLTASVKDQKAKRRDLNRQITKKIEEVKKLKTVKTERTHNPGAIKRHIEALEKRVETEALSFAREKRLMKEIKELRKQYNQAKEKAGNWEKIKELSKEIDTLKKEADGAHKVVQESASKSQTKHEALVGTSKQIDDLKKKEREAHAKFIELKTEFNKYNEELKKLQPEMKAQRKARDQDRKKRHEEIEAQKQKTLKERAQEVEEKIKKGKVKLTTEDLIAFQQKQ